MKMDFTMAHPTDGHSVGEICFQIWSRPSRFLVMRVNVVFFEYLSAFLTSKVIFSLHVPNEYSPLHIGHPLLEGSALLSLPFVIDPIFFFRLRNHGIL